VVGLFDICSYANHFSFVEAGVTVINGMVYAVGGFNGSLRVRTVDMYDPIRDVWSPMASMEARRSTLGAAVLNSMIYAVGGFDGSSGDLFFIISMI
jgi:kelch-like protein 2/3